MKEFLADFPSSNGANYMVMGGGKQFHGFENEAFPYNVTMNAPCCFMLVNDAALLFGNTALLFKMRIPTM